MRLFRFEIIFVDGTSDFGMVFGTHEMDAYEYVTNDLSYAAIRSVGIYQCDDMVWPSPAECPMGE